ncbi:odorant receptor Or2-like [Atheta coriaria]|uniref:odorant receptor Or2-like n=1 Tax=Dalotia coriaria TaxID=877792 RepID=UPI0031F44661
MLGLIIAYKLFPLIDSLLLLSRFSKLIFLNNHNEKHIMHYMMKIMLVGLRINGMDPTTQNCFFKILMFLNGTSVVTVFIINLLELLLNWHGVETFGDVHLISSTSILAAKCIYISINQSKLLNLINTVGKFWKFDKFDVDTETRITGILDRAMAALKFFASAVMGTAFSMLISGLLNRELIFPGYDICNLQSSPCYEINMVWQTYFCYFELFPIVMGFDGLFVCFIGYAYCNLEMLKVALKQMTLVIKKNHLPPNLRYETEEEKRLVKSNLTEIVEQHAQVMQFIKEINKFYSPMMLVHSGSSLFSLIFCLYMITLDGIPPKFEVLAKYASLLTTVCFQYLIFCYAGTIILEQSKSMEHHFYDLDWWYKTQPDFRHSVLLMIARAQAAPKLKIGNMDDLNLESYLAVLRNGVSAFTLMRTMSNSDKLNAL